MLSIYKTSSPEDFLMDSLSVFTEIITMNNYRLIIKENNTRIFQRNHTNKWSKNFFDILLLFASTDEHNFLLVFINIL